LAGTEDPGEGSGMPGMAGSSLPVQPKPGEPKSSVQASSESGGTKSPHIRHFVGRIHGLFNK
jgi:hypothetical protein